MAKAIVKTLEEVPEALREEYVEQDGLYVLKLDGEHPALAAAQKTAEAKFRQRNIDQAKELETARRELERFKGVDPAEHAALKAKITELEKVTGTKEPANVAALIQQQVAAALGPVQEKLRLAEEREAQKNAALARKNVESALRDAAVKAGVDDPALPDFLHRGLEVFTFDEDRVVAKDKDGAPVFSKARPGSELSPEEWAFGLAETAPHLFRPSDGGGAPGGSGRQQTDRGGGKWVDGSSPLEIGRNLEDIATGKIKVSVPGR